MESKSMEYIIGSLQALKEDRPHLIITRDFVKEWVEEYLEQIVDEVMEEL